MKLIDSDKTLTIIANIRLSSPEADSVRNLIVALIEQMPDETKGGAE